MSDDTPTDNASAGQATDNASAAAPVTLLPAPVDVHRPHALTPFIEAERARPINPLEVAGAGVRYLLHVGDIHGALRVNDSLLPFRAPRLSAVALGQGELFGVNSEGAPIKPLLDDKGRHVVRFVWGGSPSDDPNAPGVLGQVAHDPNIINMVDNTAAPAPAPAPAPMTLPEAKRILSDARANGVPDSATAAYTRIREASLVVRADLEQQQQRAPGEGPP